jgi:membrane protein implicated in regulation of membrane protease activity
VWRARNAGASTLARGARVRVESVEGVTLVLRG